MHNRFGHRSKSTKKKTMLSKLVHANKAKCGLGFGLTNYNKSKLHAKTKNLK